MWSLPDTEILGEPDADTRSPGMAVRWDPQELAVGGAARFFDARHVTDEVAVDEAEIAELANTAREQALADEIERRVAEAYAMGFDDGRREGADSEAVRLRTAIEAAEGAVDAFRETESRWHGGLEENICALAIAVAKQILERELRSSPRVVSELVRRAITLFPIDQPIRIRIAPSDLAMISSAGADASPSPLTGAREVRWIPDAQVAPGGCVIEGRERIIDGRVDSALERLYRRLTHTSA